MQFLTNNKQFNMNNQKYVYLLSVGFERANFYQSWLYQQVEKRNQIIKTVVPVLDLVEICLKLSHKKWLTNTIIRLLKKSENLELINKKYPNYTYNRKKYPVSICTLKENLTIENIKEVCTEIKDLQSDIEIIKLGDKIYLIDTEKLFGDNNQYKKEGFIYFLFKLLINKDSKADNTIKYRFVVHDKEVGKIGDNYISDVKSIEPMVQCPSIKIEIVTFMHQRVSSKVYEIITNKDYKDISKFEEKLDLLFNFRKERLAVYHFLRESLNQYRIINDNSFGMMNGFIKNKLNNLSPEMKQKCCETEEFKIIENEVSHNTEDGYQKAYELIGKQIDLLT
jgi:hypothetical protein